MTKEEAISVLLQVAEVAQSKGILNLKDATIVYQATVVLTEKEVEPMPMPMVDPEKVIKTEPRK